MNVATASTESKNDWTGLVLLVAAILALGFFASWNWAFIVVAIVFMIFMHEMGHYLTARWTGMKVTEFFIGFGPRLWSFRKGETEYGVKAIPAGAYVRIIGMNNLDPVPAGDEERTYRAKSFPRKLLVVTAGSAMHFMMAIVLLFSFLMWKGTPSADGGWRIGSISDQSAAALLDLEVGDKVISVDGIEITDFVQFGEVIAPRGGQPITIVYESDGESVTEQVVLGARLSLAGALGIRGLEERDRILQIDGIDVASWADVEAVAADRINTPVEIVFDPARGTRLQVVSNAVITELRPAAQATTGFFGVSAESERDSHGPITAFITAVTEFENLFRQVTVGMWHTLTGGALPTFVGETLSGNVDTVHDDITSTDAGERELASRALDQGDPDERRIISIYGAARFGSQITGDGLDRTLLFLAGLNISVGFLNLLPLPPLDGGHVVIATYERIRSFGGRRHEVDYNRVLPFTYAIFMLLSVVGLVAIIRDVIDPINLG